MDAAERQCECWLTETDNKQEVPAVPQGRETRREVQRPSADMRGCPRMDVEGQHSTHQRILGFPRSSKDWALIACRGLIAGVPGGCMHR